MIFRNVIHFVSLTTELPTRSFFFTSKLDRTTNRFLFNPSYWLNDLAHMTFPDRIIFQYNRIFGSSCCIDGMFFLFFTVSLFTNFFPLIFILVFFSSVMYAFKSSDSGDNQMHVLLNPHQYPLSFWKHLITYSRGPSVTQKKSHRFIIRLIFCKPKFSISIRM